MNEDSWTELRTLHSMRSAHGQVNVNIAHTTARGITWTMPEMPLCPAERRREEKRDCVLLCAKNRELCLEIDPETKKTRLGKCSNSPFQRSARACRRQ